MRLQLFLELLTTTRIFVVVMAANMNWRQALSLPVTLPLGTVTQAAPFQYCTSKSSIPSKLAEVLSVGAPAFCQLF